MLRLVWRDRALADLEAAISYISDRNIAAAERLQMLIEHCAEGLPAHPFLYRPGRVEGTREAVVHPNYIVIYRVTTEAIEITSVVHARRQYP
ncbi:type II toxin-antitoxin system RelE/ParE family toxin [Sphingobium boeckii]|uniref:Addiction module RelE/StbE family toxin n=1 Tax=Sphingobium boeckii TaxID=1082345 RepID=A0A7W9AHV6_9SPHN|nr:type II toxin-antitoxin system RelE/ParE family toxin [Sphingobium boeckii]MBB5685797.1 addiction module RelE/StbE family toxin [Sphingobium boeckii]